MRQFSLLDSLSRAEQQTTFLALKTHLANNVDAYFHAYEPPKTQNISDTKALGALQLRFISLRAN